MTVEALLKLESISDSNIDLEWRTKSYDAGHPLLCTCSACGERILDSEDFDDPDGEEAQDHTAIRLWRGQNKATEEATLHLSCFTMLHSKGVLAEPEQNDDINYDEQF